MILLKLATSIVLCFPYCLPITLGASSSVVNESVFFLLGESFSLVCEDLTSQVAHTLLTKSQCACHFSAKLFLFRATASMSYSLPQQ